MLLDTLNRRKTPSDGVYSNQTLMMNHSNCRVKMLEYCKMILGKFTFDKALFRKEYRKSLQYLSVEDQRELKQWVRGNSVANHQIKE